MSLGEWLTPVSLVSLGAGDHLFRRCPLGNGYPVAPGTPVSLVWPGARSTLFPVSLNQELGIVLPTDAPDRWVWVDTRQMPAPTQDDVDLKSGRHTGQNFQTDTLGQSVLDFRPGSLADPTRSARPRLRLEFGEPLVAKLGGEAKHDVLDRGRLLAKSIRHWRIRPLVAHPRLITPARGPGRAVVARSRYSPRGIVEVGGFRRPHEHDRHGTYNRHLTGGGRPRPTFARPPGGPIA